MSESKYVTRRGLQDAGMVIPSVRFEDEIEAFLASDRRRPPSPGGILFVGDSDIRFWNDGGQFEADFNAPGRLPLPAINRGFGGARTWEVLLYFPHIVLPHQPSVIVYLAGDNDIASLRAEGARSALTGFRLFLELASEHLPQTRRVLYLPIHRSPVNEQLWDVQRQANEQLQQLCEESALADYADYLPLLADDEGYLRQDAFRADGLHWRTHFYAELADWLRPQIIAAAGQ